MLALSLLYFLSALNLALYGCNALYLSLVYLRHRKDRLPAPPDPDEWPRVLVQLPVYNERHVIERLLLAVLELDYPAHQLTIQLLDDSTDDTSAIAQSFLGTYDNREIQIQHVRRGTREGYKARALAVGLDQAPIEAELIVVFDADFVPRPDFLRRIVPYFADASVGMVQARWSHLNSTETILTRAQALALDAHFVIEQTARHRGGFFMNFSGTAGMWRRTCIDDAGGWQDDTLSEDIDLSYRAQLRGWRFLYVPHIDAPAEIPRQIAAFKNQQARWATGTISVLLKLWKTLVTAQLRPMQIVQGLLHLSGYLVHPLMMLLILSSLPLMLLGGLKNLPLAPLGVAAFAPLLMAIITQSTLYRSWPRRLLVFPFMLLIGTGIALRNTFAVMRALGGRPDSFRRTPKSGRGRWTASTYALPIERTTWGELILSAYALAGALLAVTRGPELAPLLVLYGLGFGYVGSLGVWQARRLREERRRSRVSLAGLPQVDVPH